jgi:hypothetical protein
MYTSLIWGVLSWWQMILLITLIVLDIIRGCVLWMMCALNRPATISIEIRHKLGLRWDFYDITEQEISFLVFVFCTVWCGSGPRTCARNFRSFAHSVSFFQKNSFLLYKMTQNWIGFEFLFYFQAVGLIWSCFNTKETR